MESKNLFRDMVKLTPFVVGAFVVNDGCVKMKDKAKNVIRINKDEQMHMPPAQAEEKKN